MGSRDFAVRVAGWARWLAWDIGDAGLRGFATTDLVHGVGTVRRSDHEGIVLEESSGLQHTFTALDSEPTPPVGHQIMAVLDSTGQGVRSFYDLAVSKEMDIHRLASVSE
jgi:hypothetical protein